MKIKSKLIYIISLLSIIGITGLFPMVANAENYIIPYFVKNDYVTSADQLYDYYLSRHPNENNNINNKFCYYNGQNDYYWFYSILLLDDTNGMSYRFGATQNGRVRSNGGNTYSAEIYVSKSTGEMTERYEYSYIDVTDPTRVYDLQGLDCYYEGTEDIFIKAVEQNGQSGAGQVGNIGVNGLDEFKPDFDIDDNAPDMFKNIYNLLGTIRNAINNQFNKLNDLLGGKLDFISDILTGIKDFVSNITDKIEEQLREFKEFVEYFTEPIDIDRILQAINDNNLIGKIVNIGQNINIGLFNGTGGSYNSTNIPTFHYTFELLNHRFSIDFDFSWYEPIREKYLNVLLTFLYVGFGLYMFKQLPNIISGIGTSTRKGQE